MTDGLFQLSRRNMLRATAALTGAAAMRSAAQSPAPAPVYSIRDFGAVPGRDNTQAIQRAVDAAQQRGGGIVEIPGSYECGVIEISGDGVTLRGRNGWLVNGRIAVREQSRGCRIERLGIVDRRGDAGSYAIEIAGQNCTLADVTLLKDPIAGGYQMYLRHTSSHCRFDGLRLKGSNGVMVAGHDHLFENFEFESTMSDRVGGDDAFAIKAAGQPTSNIRIRNGVVRGFAAAVSFGSEIGMSPDAPARIGSIRDVIVTDVTADRCSLLAFFKPGALIYDWRNGLIENVRLERLRLIDERGERFTSGVRMIAARGGVVRNVIGRALEIRARAKNQGIQPTAAIDLTLLDEGAPARFENIDLQLDFADPHEGAAHAQGAPGYPVDHIARIEKWNPNKGRMSGISLDVSGRGSRIGGVFIGQGLDDAVTLRRARLHRVGLNPPAVAGAGGIWSDSQVRLGEVVVDSPALPPFGGRALARPR